MEPKTTCATSSGSGSFLIPSLAALSYSSNPKKSDKELKKYIKVHGEPYKDCSHMPWEDNITSSLNKILQKKSMHEIIHFEEKHLASFISDETTIETLREALILPVKENLSILQRKVVEFVLKASVRTTFSDQLLTEVQKVEKLNCVELISYLSTPRTHDKDIFKTIQKTLGRKSKEQRKVLEELTVWSNPDHLPQVKQKALQYVEKMKEISLIPYQRFIWVEPEKCPKSIFNITPAEIRRCFVQQKMILFDQIFINDIPLLPLTIEAENEIEWEFEFFKRLFLALDPDSNPETIHNQALNLVKEEGEQFPLLYILQCSTIGAWSQAQEFLFQKFPGVFSNALWTRASSGIVLCINGEKVCQKKQYKTYRKLDPKNAHSKSVDQDAVLCEYTFAWTLSPFVDKGRETLKGVFEILECKIAGKKASDEEKWQILDTLVMASRVPSSNVASIKQKRSSVSSPLHISTLHLTKNSTKNEILTHTHHKDNND